MALPDLEGWAIFATVAERRSFSAAAAALGVSKATVSKAVARLERRLGVTLFHRTSRRLALTEAGAGLVERARLILAEAITAEDCAREVASQPSGTVRLAAPMSFGLSHVGPVVARFLEAYPEIEVDLQLSDAKADLVGEGFDAALRIGALADSSLLTRMLRPVALTLYAAPAYLAARGTPAHPRELEHHGLFCYSYADGEQTLRLMRGDELCQLPLRGRLRANNAVAMLPALVAGHGIALLPDFIADKPAASGSIVPVLPDWAPPPIALHLVTPPGRLRPRRVEALLAFLTDAFAIDSHDSAT